MRLYVCFQEGCWFETILPKSSAGFSKGEDDELICDHSEDDLITHQHHSSEELIITF